MKKIIVKTSNISKLDIINAESSQSFRELAGATEPVAVKGAAIIEDTNKDGEVGQFAYVFCEGGRVYGGNSATIRRSVEALIDVIEEDASIEYGVTVDSRPTASGREFLSLRVTTLEA